LEAGFGGASALEAGGGNPLGAGGGGVSALEMSGSGALVTGGLELALVIGGLGAVDLVTGEIEGSLEVVELVAEASGSWVVNPETGGSGMGLNSGLGMGLDSETGGLGVELDSETGGLGVGLDSETGCWWMVVLKTGGSAGGLETREMSE
jgi:hypothetical protein